MSRRMNDARLWALMMDPLRDAGLERDAAERLSRQLMAVVRRERMPQRRTFAPGDPLPSPSPARLADCDGDVWEHQEAGNGMYRMSEHDRRRNADSTEDVEGVRLWPFLLDEYGPLTEIPEES